MVTDVDEKTGQIRDGACCMAVTPAAIGVLNSFASVAMQKLGAANG